jgi:hypothetical protein
MATSDETIGAPYPPAPWRLRGQAYFHVMLLPAERLPATPDGFRPLIKAGRGVVIAGWVDYQGGSILRYGELLVAVVGHASRGLTATVTHMWVDSPASRAGGRELWGYPKELADFDLRIGPSGTASARLARGGPELARGTFHATIGLPMRVTVNGGTVQPLGGELIDVRAAFKSRPTLGRGTFNPAPDGPLAFLAGARTLVSLGLRDFHFTFGL